MSEVENIGEQESGIESKKTEEIGEKETIKRLYDECYKEMYLSVFSEVTDAIEILTIIQTIAHDLTAFIRNDLKTKTYNTITNQVAIIEKLAKIEIKNLKSAQQQAENNYIVLFSDYMDEEDENDCEDEVND